MKHTALCLVLLLTTLVGCRGWTSSEAPIHLNPNMDTQIKYKPYRESNWFKDGRDMRPKVQGTVARGFLKEDEHFYKARVSGQVATSLPQQIVLDGEFLHKGEMQFNIRCAPCHGQAGEGNGLVGRKLPVPPTPFHTDYMRGQPLGHYFDVITQGIRTMPSYEFVSEENRWAIAAYIQALQLSQKPDGEWLHTKSLNIPVEKSK